MGAETKHTPGPWRVSISKASGTRIAVEAAMGTWVADARPWSLSRRSVAEQEANALLIAAAPEILEALEALLPAAVAVGVDDFSCEFCPADDHEGPGHTPACSIVLARAAITKARGK